MPDILKDGTGSGYLAKVNSSNQLTTFSTSIATVGTCSILGDVFFIPMLFRQVSGGTEELAAVVTYTGVRTCIFQLFIVSSQDANTCVATIYGGTTYASGGYTSSAANLNTSSSKTFPGTIKIQADQLASFVTPSFGSHMFSCALTGYSTFQLDTRDALIIRPNLPIGLSIKAQNTNSYVRAYGTMYETD